MYTDKMQTRLDVLVETNWTIEWQERTTYIWHLFDKQSACKLRARSTEIWMVLSLFEYFKPIWTWAESRPGNVALDASKTPESPATDSLLTARLLDTDRVFDADDALLMAPCWGRFNSDGFS